MINIYFQTVLLTESGKKGGMGGVSAIITITEPHSGISRKIKNQSTSIEKEKTEEPLF